MRNAKRLLHILQQGQRHRTYALAVKGVMHGQRAIAQDAFPVYAQCFFAEEYAVFQGGLVVMPGSPL